MDSRTTDHLGFLLSLGEVNAKVQNYLLKNITNIQLDALCSVVLNTVYENLTLTEEVKRKLAVFGPLMLLLCQRKKSRSHKKKTLLKYSRFVRVLMQTVREQLLNYGR